MRAPKSRRPGLRLLLKLLAATAGFAQEVVSGPGAIAGVILITLLQSILWVIQIDEAGRQFIYGAAIIGMLLLCGRQKKVA